MDTVVKKRKWDHTAEFICTCISMSVGLGNFWRFPVICYQNGGGAFLLPYITIALCIGRPMYYLDLTLGQFSGKGSISLCYKLAPGWLGLGICQTICCICAFSYYAHILAIVIWYLIHSFTTELPWTKCDERWGNNCVTVESATGNKSGAMSSSEAYMYKEVLLAADDLDHGLGIPDWRMLICLFVIWVAAFLVVIWGIKSSGKIAYFTALFPYVILIVLLVRSCLNPGATDGLLYFFTPTWVTLMNPKVWVAAASQMFFSLGIGYGTGAMYASYSDISANTRLISYIIATVDTLTSLLCGMAIFAAIGNLAYRLEVGVADVIKGDGLTLGFVSYPDAISRFEQVPYLFAVILFLMFLSVGLGSLCSFQQLVTTNMMEMYTPFRDWQVAAITSIFGFILGIIYTTPGGQGMVMLVDLYGNVYLLMVNSIVTAIAVFYVYGLQNICWDLEFMSKLNASFLWRWSSAILTMFVMVAVLVCACLQDGWLMYNKKPVPTIMMVSAYILLVVNTLPIPVCIMYFWIKFRKEGMTSKESLEKTFSSENWYPNDEELIEEVKAFRENKLSTYPLKENSKTSQFFHALVKNY